MKELITRFIDFFYPPFRKMMPAQTFRYAACGGGNAVFGLFTYFIGYQYIFDGLVFDLGFYAFKRSFPFHWEELCYCKTTVQIRQSNQHKLTSRPYM
ncbi:MAG: hypothetical protein WD135_07075 [Ferruginibacter sp.]